MNHHGPISPMSAIQLVEEEKQFVTEEAINTFEPSTVIENEDNAEKERST
jgi:hypothetical protein